MHMHSSNLSLASGWVDIFLDLILSCHSECSEPRIWSFYSGLGFMVMDSWAGIKLPDCKESLFKRLI